MVFGIHCYLWRFAIGSIRPPLHLLTFAAYLFWLRSVYRELHQAGFAGLRHTPSSAVWWHFVPVANLWKPIDVMQEVQSHSVSCKGAGEPVSAEATTFWWIVGMAVQYLVASETSWRLRMGGGIRPNPPLGHQLACSMTALAFIGLTAMHVHRIKPGRFAAAAAEATTRRADPNPFE